MANAQNDEEFFYLTPTGWRAGSAPDGDAQRFEAWVQVRQRRLPWMRERVQWQCLWADVSTPRDRRDALRARHPFPPAHAPTSFGLPK